MIYEHLISDFAERTLANLDVVAEVARKEPGRPYEVTQLWNSLLGLVVAPRERDQGRIPNTPLQSAHAAGCPEFMSTGALKMSTVKDLVGALRNAVAHFNVEFFEGSNDEIGGVLVWNNRKLEGSANPPPRAEQERTWEAKIDVVQLERLARYIAGVYLQRFGRRAA